MTEKTDWAGRVLQEISGMPCPDSQPPAWLAPLIRDVRHARIDILIKAMGRAGEDYTDNTLWRQRREQLDELLIASLNEKRILP